MGRGRRQQRLLLAAGASDEAGWACGTGLDFEEVCSPLARVAKVPEAPALHTFASLPTTQLASHVLGVAKAPLTPWQSKLPRIALWFGCNL